MSDDADPAAGTLADVLPAALDALRGHGHPRIAVPPAHAVVVVLIDGLGWNLLHRHRDLAPTLLSLHGRPLWSGFPTTTAAALASLTTGVRSGVHGITGYSSPWGAADGINWLSWTSTVTGRDLRRTHPPETAQPLPTQFERARASGFHPVVVSSRAFAESGLTRALFRGGAGSGSANMSDTVARIAAAARPGALVYGYLNDLDLIGHIDGIRSAAWQVQLQVLDRAMELLLERLPTGTTVIVTGDHGMVDVPEHAKVDLDADPRLTEDVLAVTGEPRNRYLTVRPGRIDFVRNRWRDSLGEGFTVRTRDEAIATGLFGPEVTPATRERIGDLVVTANGPGAVVRRVQAAGEAALIGCHGAATDDETIVPLLTVHL